MARKTNRILILATGYYGPRNETVGFNTLTEDVTQAFSTALQPKLAAANKTPINVNDKSLKYSSQQRLAIHAAKHDADGAVVLSVEPQVTHGEYSTHLRVQYFELRNIMKDGVPSGVIPINALERSSFFRGPKGDTAMSFEDLAQQFFVDLKSAGRL